ncbi:Transposase (plasmid) [Roseomonas mucosa]|nr:Transposase [Roseomonas mucosa]
MLLKLYLYGYLNRVPSSRRLEREAQRNLEVLWLTGRLTPDFKTIADFRRDNGPAIKATCRPAVEDLGKVQTPVPRCLHTGVQRRVRRQAVTLKPAEKFLKAALRVGEHCLSRPSPGQQRDIELLLADVDPQHVHEHTPTTTGQWDCPRAPSL